MKKVNSFEDFEKLIKINESEIELIKEDKAYYEKEGYIEDANIKDEAALLAKIEKEITPAWNEFVKSHKIEHGEGTININKKYIELEAKPITGKDLGVFVHGLKFAQLTFFSGRQINRTDVEGTFMFQPRIWCTLSIHHEHLDGGTNGIKYKVDENNERFSNDLYYDILKGKWFTNSEWKNENK